MPRFRHHDWNYRPYFNSGAGLHFFSHASANWHAEVMLGWRWPSIDDFPAERFLARSWHSLQGRALLSERPPLSTFVHLYTHIATIAKVLKKIISYREKNHEKEPVQLRPHEADLARPGDRNEGRSMRLLLRTIRQILPQRRADLRRR